MRGMRPEIILFGDSITQHFFSSDGWGSALAHHYTRKADILNRGYYGLELPERTNETTGRYANQCVSLAEELGIPYTNLWSKMQETVGWKNIYLSDGLHLTSQGNVVVYNEVVQVLDQTSFSAQSLPYDFPPSSEIDEKNPEKAFKHSVHNATLPFAKI